MLCKHVKNRNLEGCDICHKEQGDDFCRHGTFNMDSCSSCENDMQKQIDALKADLEQSKARCEELEEKQKYLIVPTNATVVTELLDKIKQLESDRAAAKKEREAILACSRIYEANNKHLEKQLSETQAKLASYEKKFADEWMSKADREAQEKVIERVRALENPYPEDVFIEPTHEQFQAFNKYLEQFGISPDAYNGSMGRRTWNNLMAKIKEAFLGEIGE